MRFFDAKRRQYEIHMTLVATKEITKASQKI